MTDRELLEYAAKAAGIGSVLCYETARNCLRIGDRKSYFLWQPLTDDGDALRLAVMARLDLHMDQNLTMAVNFTDAFSESHFNDPYAATRRAIVRAAAEIGKAM